ncbi:hypothetical protein AHF37_00644 [Paragonimus kellicotti]|nr:hypothetical protein AHF37_00644 [Paragonimus kellicotti]
MHEDDVSADSGKPNTLFSKRENSSSSESIFHEGLLKNCSRIGESSNYPLLETTRHFPLTSPVDSQIYVSKTVMGKYPNTGILVSVGKTKTLVTQRRVQLQTLFTSSRVLETQDDLRI